MSESGSDRAKLSQENRQVTDTLKALIEVYKSAFGEHWAAVFKETVKLSI
jgi:hypothetical protein